MDTKDYYLNVVSAEKQIFSGLVKYIKVSSYTGAIGILAGHAPLLALLKQGVLNIVQKHDKKEQIYISGGILEVQPNMVIILVDAAVL